MKDFWENIFHKQTKETKIYEILKNNILFKDLSFKELELVYGIMNPRHYKPGELIFHQGDTGVGMFIIVNGTVNIFLDEIIENQELRRTLITKLKSGDFFGESSLVIDGGQRSATVIAKEDCELLGFFYPDLKQIINKHPVTGTKILFRLGEVLGTRLRETNKKIITLISEVSFLKNKNMVQEENNSGNGQQTYTS